MPLVPFPTDINLVEVAGVIVPAVRDRKLFTQAVANAGWNVIGYAGSKIPAGAIPAKAATALSTLSDAELADAIEAHCRTITASDPGAVGKWGDGTLLKLLIEAALKFLPLFF